MFTRKYLAIMIFGLAILCSNITVKAQVPQADFKSIVYYDVWSYDAYPPFRMQYNGIKQLVIFGGATTGITPSTTSPYFPARDYTSFAYRSTFHGDGWANMSKYFPGTTKTWMQLIRDSCNAHGIDLYLDLGGEYGASATAFNSLISDRTKWTAYINAVSDVCQSNPDGVHFDGISFDIEWLGNSVQSRQDFTDFVAAFKAKLNTWPKPGKIGAATAMWFLWSNNPSTPYITPATVNAYFDWLFIMGYNTFNSSKLGFEAQVYQNPAITGVEVWNDRATTQYTANGVNPKIVVLGTSGEVLKQTITGSAVPGGPATGSTTASGSGPVVNQIFNTAVLDPISKSSYAISGSTWYSFETLASTNEKIKISQSYGLGGIGYYSTFASSDGNGATSVNKTLNAYQNAIAAVIGGSTGTQDVVAPVVSITAPVNGASVSGSVTISANASDNVGVARVDFLVNGTVASSDNSSPYSYSWNTAGLSGSQTLLAKAYDAAGNVGTSASVAVSILGQQADTTKPSVSITSPINGSSVSGTTVVNASASDNVGVKRVDFLVNGVVAFSDTVSPYSYAWNTGSLTGSQALSAKAYDAAGNVGVSTTVTVSISVQSLPPVPILLSPANGATLTALSTTVSWNASSGATSYEVQASVSSGFTTTLLDDSTVTATSRQVTSLANTMTYFWRVRAKNSSGWSAYSAAWTFTTQSSSVADQWISNDGIVSPWIDASWSATNTFSNTSVIYAGTTSIKTVLGGWGALRFHSGSWGTPVNVNPAGYSTLEFAVYATAGSASLDISVGNDATSMLTQVVYANLPVNQWVIISYPLSTLNPGNLPITYLTIENGTAGSQTFYVDNIRFVSGSPVVLPPPVPVLLLPANGVTATAPSTTVSWNASAGATLYQVQASVSSGFATTILNDSTITTTSRLVSSLINSTTYYWRARAKSSSGWSTYSAAWNFITQPSATTDQWIYNNGLVSPWVDASQSATNTFSSTDVLYSGATTSIKTVLGGGGTLRVHSGVNVNPAGYSTVEFAIYATSGYTKLDISVGNDVTSVFKQLVYTNLPVNQWVIISYPLSTINPNNLPITYLTIKNGTGSSKTFYVDNVRFVGLVVASSTVKVDVKDGSIPAPLTDAPHEFALMQNYPNPFNPTTRIDYQLKENAHVALTVYNILGSEVNRLVEGEQGAGLHTAIWNGGDRASGIYFARLTVTDNNGNRLYQQMMRMLLTK